MSFKESEHGASPDTLASSPQPLATTEYAEVRKDASTHSIVESNKSVTPSPVEEEAKGNWLFCTVFLICGAAQLYYWNALLNMLFDVVLVHFPNYPKLSDTMTAFYGTFNFIFAILMSWRGGLNFTINIVAGIILCAVSILTPVCAIYPSEKSAMILLHVCAAVAGGSCGCFQGGHYALAGSLPKSYTAWVSTGNGIAGVFTFVLWMIFSQAAFPDDIDKSLWITSGVGTALLVITIVAVFYFYRRPDVHANIEKMREQGRAERKDPNRLRYVEVFKLCWRPLVCILFIFFISLLLFPNIGPLRWNSSGSVQTNVNMGMFQIGDLIGRYIPTLASKLPWVLFSVSGLFWATGARIIFVLFFVLFWKVNNAAFSNVGFQVVIMLLFSITNGWFCTVGLTRAPQAIQNPAYKYRGGALGVSALLLGLTIGLWVAKLVTLGS